MCTLVCGANTSPPCMGPDRDHTLYVTEVDISANSIDLMKSVYFSFSYYMSPLFFVHCAVNSNAYF